MLCTIRKTIASIGMKSSVKTVFLAATHKMMQLQIEAGPNNIAKILKKLRLLRFCCCSVVDSSPMSSAFVLFFIFRVNRTVLQVATTAMNSCKMRSSFALERASMRKYSLNSLLASGCGSSRRQETSLFCYARGY